MTRAGDGVGTLITRLVIFHSDWSSGFRDSSVALHWSFLHSLSRLVTDLEPVERSRTSYEVLVRIVSKGNTVEKSGVSGGFGVVKRKYIREVWKAGDVAG